MNLGDKKRKRWLTPFGLFVRSYTVDQLRIDLLKRGCDIKSNMVIYRWVKGESIPDINEALNILELSKSIDLLKPLTLADINNQSRILKPKKRVAA